MCGSYPTEPDPPPSTQQDPRQKEEAKQRYLSNLSSSALCQLPVEIILQIAEECPDQTDVLCLANTSRLLRFYLWDMVKPGHLCKCHWAREEFTYRVYRHEFLSLAEMEEQYFADMNEFPACISTLDGPTEDVERLLACSYCLEKHPISLFSRNEVLKSPFHRVCIGSQGQIRVCPHQKVTYHDLYDLKMNVLDCIRADRVIIESVYPRCQCFMELEAPRTFRTDEIEGTNCKILGAPWKIEELPVNQDIQSAFEAISAKLCDQNRQLCPHMRTSDDQILEAAKMQMSLWSMKTTTEDGRRISTLRWHPIKLQTKYAGTMLKCTHPHCHTQIKWYMHARYLYGSEHGGFVIGMYIKRWIGSLADVNDPKWLAQLEPEC